MPALTDEFIEEVASDLAANKVVSRRLPHGGRLYLDGQRPFLCVYRRPVDREDLGTDSLLLSQASFLIASADQFPALQRLVTRLVQVLSDAFGRIVLLEVWSTPASGVREEHVAPLKFQLVAPMQDAPVETLESLERGLLAADWDGAEQEIALDYVESPSSPGFEPILNPSQARQAGCTLLGLGISPHHRDPATDRALPMVLKAVRRDLGHVLKQGFFAFSHARSSYRPAHYHELGPTAVTQEVWDVDRQLAVVGDQFDLLLHVTPVNAEAAWKTFSAAGFDCEPEFLYRPLPVDPSTLKSELHRIPIGRIEDPALHQLFFEKQQELDRQLTLLGDRETRRFLYGSLQLFEAPGEGLRRLAHNILGRVSPKRRGDAQDLIDAHEFAERAQTELEYYRAMDPSLAAVVEVRDDVAGVLVSDGDVLISSYASMSATGIEATIHHEVGTHVLTHHNGLQQQFQQLHLGMAGYEELQEGVAVLAEFLSGGLSALRLRLLAGRVLAVDGLVRGARFVDTFSMLHREHGFRPRTAYSISMRVHRGGGYTKDAIYLKGLDRVLSYLQDGGDLEKLLIGKISFDHLGLIDELTWRKVLVPPRLRPRYLDGEAVQERLERVREAGSVLDLMED